MSAPGTSARRTPSRSIHAPAIGRSTTATSEKTEKSRPAWALVPPSATTWSDRTGVSE